MPASDTNNPAASEFLLTPETILQSRYRIVQHLGKGGMGAVYEAIDMRLGATVALKQTLTADKAQWKQFEQEARLMAGLNHPALPRVYDYFTEGNRAFFVMQYIEGSDLSRIIAQQPGPFPRRQALVYLHSLDRQIIHRDIKPHNLRITPSGRIALLDFGLAKSEAADSSAITCTSVFGYTPRYAPLEQIQDLGTGPRSDIYALGATLYHLLTGIKPPDAVTRAAALVSGSPNPLRPADEINPTVGPELAAILDRAMAQNPGERYCSAAEFREALRCLGRAELPSVSEWPNERETGDTTLVRRERIAGSRPVRVRTVIKIVDPENQPAEDQENPRIGEVLGLNQPSQTVADDANEMKAAVMRSRTLAGRFSSRLIAAIFVILIAAFGVFCRFYPWKLPPPVNEVTAITTTAETPSQLRRASAYKDGSSRKPRTRDQITRQ